MIAFLSWLSFRLSESPRVLSDSILHSLPSSVLYITSSMSHGIYESWYIRCSVRRYPPANTSTFYPVICVPLVCRNYPRGRLPATAITFRHMRSTVVNTATHHTNNRLDRGALCITFALLFQQEKKYWMSTSQDQNDQQVRIRRNLCKHDCWPK